MSKIHELLTYDNDRPEVQNDQVPEVNEKTEKEQPEERTLHSAPIRVGQAASDNPPSFNNRSNHHNSIGLFQKSYGNLSTLRYHNCRNPIQAKLKIGQPNDKYEQEADRIADQVMHIPEPQVQQQPREEKKKEKLIQPRPLAGQITPLVQRRVEENWEKKKDEISQAQENFSQTSEVTPNIESRINALKGGGQSLPESDRAFFESRFGQNFSQVRIHNNMQAAGLARALNARAFTSKQHIIFGNGAYTLETSSGKRLLAHELAHVMQQRDDTSVANTLGYAPLRRPIIQRTPEGEDSTPMSPPSETKRTQGTPVLWGMDTTSRRLYLSVSYPGHTLIAVARYLYGTPDAANRLQDTNPGLGEELRTGTTLRPISGENLSDAANTDLNNALKNGTILLTNGIPAGGAPDVKIYQFSADGRQYELTDGQFRALLRSLGAYLVRKAHSFHSSAESGEEVEEYHIQNTNSLVRGISDWLGDAERPGMFAWLMPQLQAQMAIELLTPISQGTISDDPLDTARLIASGAKKLEKTAQLLDSAWNAWHEYIGRTISGAQVAVNRLELTRNVSFGIAAGLAGAIAAPAVFAAAGTGLATVGVTGTTATVLSGTAAIGSGTVVGGTLRGGLEVVAPGAQAERPVSERFVAGFKSGAIAGGLGAAGALAAPGVSGFISSRLFRTAPQALTGFGARATVNVLTGVALGTPLGATGAALGDLGALIRGEITIGQYLERIGWSSIQGAAFGAAFGFVGTVLARPQAPTGTLARPTSAGRSGSVPPFETTPLRFDPRTGIVTQMARNTATGEIAQITYNIFTNTGRIVNLSTGQASNIINLRIQAPPAGLLPPGASTGGPAAAVTTGLVPTGTALAPTPSVPGTVVLGGPAAAVIPTGGTTGSGPDGIREIIVETYAGRLENAIATQKSLGASARITAIDSKKPPASAIAELERYGGQFIQASDLSAIGEGTASRIVAHYPWKTGEPIVATREMLLTQRFPMTTEELPAQAMPRLRVGGQLEIVTELEYVATDLIEAANNLRIPARGGGHYVFEVSAETTTAGIAAPHSPGLQVLSEGGPVPPDTPVYRVIMTKRFQP